MAEMIATIGRSRRRNSPRPRVGWPEATSAIFGSLLPIYALSPLGPRVFDVARAPLLVVLATYLVARRAMWIGRPWLLLAALFGTYGVLYSNPRLLGGALFLAVGATIGHSIGRHAHLVRSLVTGFMVGASLSAAAVILDAVFGVHVGAVHAATGSAGLSYRSTSVSYDMAIGAAGAYWCLRTTRRPWLFACGAVCLIGIALSGGRGGLLAALAATAGVGLLVRGRRARVLVHSALLALALISLVGPRAVTFGRFTDVNPNTDFSSGRVGLQRAAWTTLRHHPLTGAESQLKEQASGERVHNAILGAGVVAGVPGAATMGFIVLQCCREIARWARRRVRPGDPSSSANFVVPLLAVYIVYVFTSTGPNAGLSPAFMMATLLSYARSSRRGTSVGGESQGHSDGAGLAVDRPRVTGSTAW